MKEWTANLIGSAPPSNLKPQTFSELTPMTDEKRSMINVQWLAVLAVLSLPLLPLSAAELKDLSVNGGIQDGKARLIIEAQLAGLTGDKNTLLFASTHTQVITVGTTKITHAINATIDILQGQPNELVFTLSGDGEITKVTGEALQDWS